MGTKGATRRRTGRTALRATAGLGLIIFALLRPSNGAAPWRLDGRIDLADRKVFWTRGGFF